jgi:hypothetical protein
MDTRSTPLLLIFCNAAIFYYFLLICIFCLDALQRVFPRLKSQNHAKLRKISYPTIIFLKIFSNTLPFFYKTTLVFPNDNTS